MIDYFLLKFASKIAFGRREPKSKKGHRLQIHGPPDHLQEEIMGNWARPPCVEIVEIMEIEKTGNFQAQFSLLNFDYFLLKFASKIAFGRRERKKKGHRLQIH